MRKITKCMLCGSEDLFPFLDLGFQPHSDQFRADNFRPEMTYPLGLQFCNACTLVQLTFLVDRKELFTEDYLYESSITTTANLHWQEFADNVVGIVRPKGLVVEIGSNDGTLLKKFKDKGLNVLGIDPCAEVTSIATKNGINTITEFFCFKVVKMIKEKAALIIGSNVFAHLDDYKKFLKNVKKLLAPNGVLVLESPYIMNFINELQYDTAYHQHMLYTGLIPMKKYFESKGLEIFNVQFTPIHGGSFRCYIGHKGQHEVNPIVSESIAKEIVTHETLKDFTDKVLQNRFKLISLLNEFKRTSRTIVALSSPAKGQTLLNYTGAGKYLSFATDKSKLKQGRYTPGTHLLIKSDEDLTGDEVCVLLAWNFAEEIIRNNPKIKTWIIPNPSPTVVER